MYLHYYFLLLVGYLFCFSRHVLAAPSPNSSGLGDGKPNTRGNPHDSAYNDEKQPPGGDTSISRNTRRAGPLKTPAREIRCNILKNHYVFHENLAPRIKEFCLEFEHVVEWKKETSMTRVYYRGTKEQVKISAYATEDIIKPNKNGCSAVFSAIMDDCSLPDPITNPHNVKAGGVYTSNGDHTFKIQPEMERETPDLAITATCHCLNGPDIVNVCRLSGHGWAAVDKGARLRDELEDKCTVKDGSFTFKTLDKLQDGWEWTASVKMEHPQRDCVGDISRRMGGPADLECTGT